MILANYGIVSSGGSSPLLLDTYSGATTAYSLRKLRTAYTGYAIRVRRSSDNNSQDIGFDGSGNLDTTSLTSFVGSNSGYVSIWYDQSGNSLNMVQNTSAIQPTIVSSGAIVTNGSKNAVYFNSQRLGVASPNFNISNSSVFFVGKSVGASINSAAIIVMNSNPDDNPEVKLAGGYGAINSYWNSAYAINTPNLMDTTKVYSSIINGNITHTVWGNGTQIATGTRTGTFNNITEFTLGGYVRTNGYQNGYASEVIMYTNDQSSNRTNIESNINTIY
jgi:predicted RecA/RadA family phage recombinase